MYFPIELVFPSLSSEDLHTYHSFYLVSHSLISFVTVHTPWIAFNQGQSTLKNGPVYTDVSSANAPTSPTPSPAPTCTATSSSGSAATANPP